MSDELSVKSIAFGDGVPSTTGRRRTADPPLLPFPLCPEWLAPLEAAAASLARLDAALDSHPLAPAWLYRARLDAARREAAVDGELIDSWHLAALIEGVRFRLTGDSALDRGATFAAARHALDLYRWRVRPGDERQEEIKRSAAHLQEAAAPHSPLVGAAIGIHSWIDHGGGRGPVRAALSRYWVERGVSRLPLPLSGAASLAADRPWGPAAWTGEFLKALDAEVADGLHLLRVLERDWQAGRHAVRDRRRGSYAAAAVDVLAAAPVVSAPTLAAALGIAPKNAGRLLENFTVLGVAVEVTHRSKRRLYGLKHLAPLREATQPEPARVAPITRRGRARPAGVGAAPAEAVPPEPPLVRIAPSPPLPRAALEEFEFGELERWMAAADEAIQRAQLALGRYTNPPEGEGAIRTEGSNRDP
jgi:hypothetical protein